MLTCMNRVNRLFGANTSRWMAAPIPSGKAMPATSTISDSVPVRPVRIPVSSGRRLE